MTPFLRSLFARIRAAFRKGELDRDFRDELSAHIDLLTEENRRQGLSPEEARRQALVKLGGIEPTREIQRDTRGLPAWDMLAQDIRFSLRTLAREPGFFIVAVLIIGLGIGATTAVFSVVNTVVLRPPAFREPERIVRIANTGEGGLSSVTSRSSNLRDWRRLNQSFDDLAGYFAFFDYGSYNLIGRGEPERLVGVGVTQTFLGMLGVQPELGRDFVDEECVWNGRKAALLTHSLWERRFGSDPAIVGQSITLNSDPTLVVGVLPRSFDFASIFSPGSRVDLLTPFPVSDETDRWGNTLAVYGRLKPGISIAKAQAELDLIDQQLAAAEPNRWGLGAAVSGLQEHITGRFRRPLIVLACAVLLVLLIACTNISNLLLARAASRGKEMAVRSALGAGRMRLIRQMLTESMVLSGCGAMVGVLIAYAAIYAVSRTTAISIPLLHTVEIDGTALAFAVAAAVFTGLLFGLVPALQVSASHEYDALRDGTRGTSEGRGRGWIRNVLVVSEVALACVLLIGAGLLLRSFVRLLDVDLGFQPEHAVAWRVDVGDRYERSERRTAFYEKLVGDIRTVPGVEAVGFTDTLPLGRNRTWPLRAKGVDYQPGEMPFALPRMVDLGYISAMRIPLISGRHFSEQETKDSEQVIIINETAARRIWPDQDPIGQIAMIGDVERRIVGVVGNVRHSSLEEEASNEMYIPVTQTRDWGAVDIVIRASRPLEAIAPGIRAVLRAADPTLPAGDVQTLGEIVSRAVSPRRFIVLLLGAFALTALILASLGIYGVISYSVSQRTQEIGIRMALGASTRNLQWGVIVKTLTLASAGTAIGAIGAFALARLISSLLYGITPSDPPTYGGTIFVLIAIAVVAGYLPARRASRIHPMTVLRSA